MRNEKQGLHVALVIFVILTIVLSVTTFIFFRSWTEQKANAKRAADEATKAQNDLKTTVAEMSTYREWLIGNPTAGQADLQTAHDADFAKAAANQSLVLPQQNYTKLVEALFVRLDEVDKARQAQADELVKLNADFKKLEAEKDKLLTEQRKLAADAATELKTKTDEHTQHDTQHAAEVTKIQEDKKKEIDALNDQIAALEAEKKKLQDETKLLAKTIEDQSLKIRDIERVSFEVADGEISWVQQGAGTVWINLGRADSLRKRITFSVWGRDVNEFAQASPKGEIEVTQILDEHLAEARIVGDSDSDPIMPGDKIFTPLWDVGRTERFGIVGFIDMDGDGRSDLAMIKELIATNGGLIDAEMDEEGKVTGPGMSVNTSYLILGEAPEEDPELNEKYKEIIDQAHNLGVESITLKEFLNYVGWSDPNNVVKFDGKGDPEDFLGVGQVGPKRIAPGGATSELFKKRKPRLGTSGGAYEKERP